MPSRPHHGRGSLLQSYVLCEAVEAPSTFIFVEEWASLEGLYAHFHSPHSTEFFTSLGEVPAKAPTGTVSETSSTTTLDESLRLLASAD